MREWKQIQGVLAGLGLAWADVWRLTIDRRAGTVVVVAVDGRKFTAEWATGLSSPPHSSFVVRRS